MGLLLAGVCDGSEVCCFVGAWFKLVGCGVGSFDVGGGVKTKLEGVDVEGFDVEGFDVEGFDVEG